MLWTDQGALRIWRGVGGTAESYNEEALSEIAAEGFTGIWLFCMLPDLMQSRVFPELNRPGAAERLRKIQALVGRAARHGLGVYLYFNDPGAVAIDHPFWKTHMGLRGVEKWRKYALCTSTTEVQEFFRDAVASAMNPLRNLGGVILITACEDLTHCWSKSAVRKGAPPPDCPRCKGREPADIILELLKTWSDVRDAHPTPFRILAWNWEWSYYYPDPQAEIVTRLPEGVELLLGFEMGGETVWQGRTIPVGEYSLSYAGPGKQFITTREAVRPLGIPVHAKIEINSTHELCSVPNLPVLSTLHSRFVAMSRLETAGFLGVWTMGSRLTLNTAAMRLFMGDPERFADEDVFLDELARRYFGLTATSSVISAWRGFSAAFNNYPFTVSVLYYGPHNDAPARRLSLRFEGKPIGRSWCADDPGDDLANALGPLFSDISSFTLEDVISGFVRIRDGWDSALPDYEKALANFADEPISKINKRLSTASPSTSGQVGDYGGLSRAQPHFEIGSDKKDVAEAQSRHRQEELSAARMLAVQFRSIVNVFRFYSEQRRVIRENGLTPPCTLPRDPKLLAIMRDEIENVTRALPLVDADPRLGWHQDINGYKYNGALIRAKIAAMEAEIDKS